MAGAVAVAVLMCVWGATEAPAGGVYRWPGTALRAGTAADPARGLEGRGGPEPRRRPRNVWGAWRPALKANPWQPLVVAVGGIRGDPGRSDRRPLRGTRGRSGRASPAALSGTPQAPHPRPVTGRHRSTPLHGREVERNIFL